MPWAPGQSGNPLGYAGPRERRRKEVFDIIKNLGHKDALETLSYLQHNEQIDPGLRIAAASALAPYCHPKMQATPTPRFIDLQLDIPEFTHVSDAESFLAKIALLCAHGHLDIQSAQELSGLVKTWIDSQYQRDRLPSSGQSVPHAPGKSRRGASRVEVMLLNPKLSSPGCHSTRNSPVGIAAEDRRRLCRRDVTREPAPTRCVRER